MKKVLRLLAPSILLSVIAIADPGDENWEAFPLPPGLDGPVFAMTTVGKNLYVAGDFEKAGAVTANGLACWNGQEWTAVLNPNDFFGAIHTLASDGRNLIVGGSFYIPSIGAANIARWTRASWERLGDGLTQQCGYGGVFALAIKGNHLYAAGRFSLAGSVAATNVAVWDGQDWAALGPGLGINGGCFFESLDVVRALTIEGNNLFAGGRFRTSGSLRLTNIASWNGDSWRDVGGGVTGGGPFPVIEHGVEELVLPQVNALQASGQKLYVGGFFRSVGGTAATNIAVWDGKVWDDLNGGVSVDYRDGTVWSIASAQNGVIVGGHFTRAGPIAANNIVQWNGSTWDAVGAGFSGPVRVLIDNLYAGGEFGVSGQMQTPFVARFDRTNWLPLQPGDSNAVIGYIWGVTASHGKAYLFGNINSAGSVPCQNVVQWDGVSWNNLGGGIPGFLAQSVPARSNLYVFGTFQMPALGATNAACWNGEAWSALPQLGQLRNDSVNFWTAVGGDETHLYLALRFFGSLPLESPLVAWDGQNWTTFGKVFSGPPFFGCVFGMSASRGHLYIWGEFDHVNEVAALNVAHWNGRSWEPLAGGLEDLGFSFGGFIRAGWAVEDHLYVLAADSTGSSRGCVAYWNGTMWQCLLEGNDLPIANLAVTLRGLYIGGHFNQLGALQVNSIVRFADPNWWSPLGSGLNNSVGYQGLAADENNVYVAGPFTTAGGKPSYHFGVWHER